MGTIKTILFLLLPFFVFCNEEIGQKIWKNECGGKVSGLVFWNPHEQCVSLGIGHFIWYPKNASQNFDPMFPKYIDFLREKGIAIPKIASSKQAPWSSREDFLKDTQNTLDLQKWLSETIELQTEFIISRLHVSVNKILQKSPELKLRIDHLSNDSRGLFALIDYLNFKGEGLSSSEQYQGKGWGLYQVLQGMKAEGIAPFKESAIARLKERVTLAPKDESRWLQGWTNRIQNY